MKYLKYFEGFGFEISTDDIISAVEDQMGIELTEEEASEVFDHLDHDEIEKCALMGDNSDGQLDEQTQFAYNEIVRQVKELHLIYVLGISKRLDKERFKLL